MSNTGRPGEPEQRPTANGPVRRPAAVPQGMTGSGAEGTDPADTDALRERPAWLLPVAIGAGVVVVVGVVVGIVLANRGGDEPGPAPAASTVVAPLPTPAAAPVARTATSAFASALPTAVLQYALESSQDDPEWIAAGALEAYTETLTDGQGGTVTVRAAQLETAQEATALLQQLTAALPAAAPAPAAATPTETAAPGPVLPQSGEVTVDGAVTGTFTVVDAGDGTGVAVWQNGTAVFRLTAPLVDAFDAYKAYGL